MAQSSVEVPPSAGDLIKNLSEKKPSKASRKGISKKIINSGDVDVTVRTFEENIRANRGQQLEKNPIISEILCTFKDKNINKTTDPEDIETAFEAVKEFIDVCTVSLTARLVTDEDSSNDKGNEITIQSIPKPRKKPMKRTGDHKLSKKVAPAKVARRLKKIKSSPTVSKGFLPEPATVLDEQPASCEKEISESSEETTRSLNSKKINEDLGFDLLSTKPRKKTFSAYAKHKEVYDQNKFMKNGIHVNKKEMTMHDLIFYNPTTNPMSNSQEAVKKNSSHNEEISDLIVERLEEENIDDAEEENTDMPVPQLKLSADGKIILDPKSLVIETSAEKSLKVLQNSSVVEENGNTFNRFTKAKKRFNSWTPLETLRFYRALNTIGTDFTLMQAVFPNRTRYDLKKKFKKEERSNRDLIDKALSAAAEFDIDILEQDIKKDEERVEIQKKAKEENIRLKRLEKEERKKKKKTIHKPIAGLLKEDTGAFENSQDDTNKNRGEEKICNVSVIRKHKRIVKEELDDYQGPNFDSLYLTETDEAIMKARAAMSYQLV